MEDGRKYLEFILLMNKNSPKYTFFISAIEPNPTSDGKNAPQTELDVFDNRSEFGTVIDTSFQEEYFANEIEVLIAFIFMNNGKEVDLRQ